MYRFAQLILAGMVLGLLASPGFAGDAGQTRARDILVLHSFHKGHIWNDSISQGIEAVLSGKGRPDMPINLHYEYMDTERVQGTLYTHSLYDFLSRKYHGSRFDAIIATDDSAFRFLMDYHRKLFPGTPVVFCGVNYYEEFEMFGHEHITGVVERIDIRQTVETALALHPDTRRLLVVVDKTDTSIATIKTFIQAFKHFRDPTLFHFIAAQTRDELRQTLGALSRGTLVLFVNFSVDRAGQKVSMAQGLEEIIRNCPVPVYSFWDNYLGSGVVGGKMASGSAHGKKAAEITARILAGTPVSAIPVFRESLNQHLFDHEQLRRFNIREDTLPQGSRIMNVPFSFYAEYKQLVWTVSAGILGLSLVILALVLNTFKRKRVETALKQFTRQLNLLHRIDRAILAGKFSTRNTREALRYARDLHQSAWSGVVLFNFRKKTAVLDALDTDTGDRTGEDGVFPIDELFPERLRNNSRLTLTSGDFHPDSFFAKILSAHGVDAFACIPLVSGKELIGALTLSDIPGHAPAPDTAVSIREVAASLAVAIQSVRLQRAGKQHQKELERLSAKVFDMQESTCRRISFELHDEIGQSLTAATINLAAIEKLMVPGQNPKVPGLVSDTREIVNRLSDQAHDLSLNLWPPMLRDFGIEPTLRWYLGRIAETADIRLVFDGSDFTQRPAEEIETALYRLSQEALTNVLKHANADRVEISITQKQNGGIFFMVEDNGRGFDPDAVLSDEKMNDRLGILGMRERISILGGRLNIRSAPGRGTCISADIPWQERT